MPFYGLRAVSMVERLVACLCVLCVEGFAVRRLPFHPMLDRPLRSLRALR